MSTSQHQDTSKNHEINVRQTQYFAAWQNLSSDVTEKIRKRHFSCYAWHPQHKVFERNTINDFHARGNEITRKQFISTIIATCRTSQGVGTSLISTKLPWFIYKWNYHQLDVQRHAKVHLKCSFANQYSTRRRKMLTYMSSLDKKVSSMHARERRRWSKCN